MSELLTAVDSPEMTALKREICADLTAMHALMAVVAPKIARLDEAGGWRGEGMRSCADSVASLTSR